MNLTEWRQWLLAVAIGLRHQAWWLVDALIQAAMLRVLISLAAQRGIMIVPA